MTQEDKELLLKDLCARLPYGVKIQVYYEEMTGSGCFDDTVWTIDNDEPFHVNDRWIENIRPYLFPLSSMTDEQLNELKSYADLKYKFNTLELVEWKSGYKTLEFWLEGIPSYCVIKVFDWLNKYHFDYRGLIEKRLAIDATGKNMY